MQRSEDNLVGSFPLQLYEFQAPISGPKVCLYLLSHLTVCLSFLSGENRLQVHVIPFDTNV